MDTFLKKNETPVVYGSQQEIIDNYPVKGESWVSQLTPDMVEQFTVEDDGTNIKITMNGQYVRVIKTMAIGDTIQIDTNKGQKNIYFNGESQFIFDRKSIFFQLPVGENTIVISADAGIKDAKASFTYSFKYLGV